MKTLGISLSLTEMGIPIPLGVLCHRAGAWLRVQCPDIMLPLPYFNGHKATADNELGVINYAGYEIQGGILTIFYKYQEGEGE